MTKKEKIAWAMARVFDNDLSDAFNCQLIEPEYQDCPTCNSLEAIDKDTLSVERVDLLYQAYLAAKKVDQGK